MDEEYKIWTKEDGTQIAITDMTDLHIKNAIEFLEQRLKELPSEYDVYAVDDNEHSDTADISVIRDDIQRWIQVFEDELVKRW